MVRIVSLNVERSRHLERFVPFLQAMQPDVVCLQELVQRDIETITAATGLHHVHFAGMAVHPADNQLFGVGILARTPFDQADTIVYAGGGSGTQLFDRTTTESKVATCRYVVARARLGGAAAGLAIATTHFPWTPDGGPRPFQFAAVEQLIARLGGSVVLTGDFNAPRGGPVFDALARVWRDCIPPEVVTSIDPKLHRAGPLQLMVDGLFATSHYAIADVCLHTGVSDHQAISATVEAARG